MIKYNNYIYTTKTLRTIRSKDEDLPIRSIYLYKNQLLFEVLPCTLLFSQSSFRKTTILFPSAWPSREFTWTVI